MKHRASFLLFIFVFLLFISTTVNSQDIYNRYGFVLLQKGDQYILKDEAYIRKQAGFNLDQSPCDMYVPYNNLGRFIKDEEYNKCITKSFIYKRYTNYELKMEIDIPVGKGNFPFIMWIHGGGWHGGNLYGHKNFSRYLASNGIAGVRISYSLLFQGAKFKDTWSDIQDALAFVKKHAVELHLDKTKFGFAGHSAGGHLSAYAAMRTKNCKLLVSMNGIYDIKNVCSGYVPGKEHDAYFGTTDNDKEFASPINYVHSDSPYCLLTYSSGDYLVDKNQIKSFEQELKNNKVPYKTIQKDYYAHAGFLGTDLYEPTLLTILSIAKTLFSCK